VRVAAFRRAARPAYVSPRRAALICLKRFPVEASDDVPAGRRGLPRVAGRRGPLELNGWSRRCSLHGWPAARPRRSRAGSPARAARDEVFVTATRHDTPALELPASASVVDAEAVGLRAPARGGDLLRDVPNVYARGVTLGGSFPGTAQAAISMRGVPRGMRTL